MNENSLSSSGLNNSQPGQNNGKKDDIDDEQEEIKHFFNVFNAFQYYRSLKNTFFCPLLNSHSVWFLIDHSD